MYVPEYVPEWEILAHALGRVLAMGLDLEQAKQQICAAISDLAIPVRVEIDKAERDIPGMIRKGRWQVQPPPRLRPEDLDWVDSKPRGAWNTGPDGVENYAVVRWGWRPRRIAMLELWTDAVIRIFCSGSNRAGTVPTLLASADAEATHEGPPETLRTAPIELIRGVVGDVYAHAQKRGMKPPNLREIAKPVQQVLERDQYCASAKQIQGIASEKRFTLFRRKPGPRVNRTLLPFSLEGWKKSGGES
jgi:hypothetical protein